MDRGPETGDGIMNKVEMAFLDTPHVVTLNVSQRSPLEGRWDKCVQHLGLRGVL